ncbi:MAG TPA: hypothetical protein VIG88_11100 [Lysobacter sp.]
MNPRIPSRSAAARTLRAVCAAAAIAGCQPSPPADDTRDTSAAAPATGGTDQHDARAAVPSQPSDATTPNTDATLPNADTPATPPAADASLPEPRTPPGDASPQAAATVVETYFGLIEAKDTARADALWRDAAAASAFRGELARLGMPRVEVDAPGGVDGAAGSMYVTVPVRFQPTLVPGNSRPRHGEAVLRRANDVPGSTEAQRRWRIERIDVAMTPK